jgi:hypothetical protein
MVLVVVSLSAAMLIVIKLDVIKLTAITLIVMAL